MKQNKQRYGSLIMLLGTLDASLLGNISAGKGVICGGLVVIQAGEGTNRAR